MLIISLIRNLLTWMFLCVQVQVEVCTKADTFLFFVWLSRLLSCSIHHLCCHGVHINLHNILYVYYDSFIEYLGQREVIEAK